MALTAAGQWRQLVAVAAGGGVSMGAPTSSEASSVEARYSPVTSMRTRDALRRGELTPRREAGACHAETRDAARSMSDATG